MRTPAYDRERRPRGCDDNMRAVPDFSRFPRDLLRFWKVLPFDLPLQAAYDQSVRPFGTGRLRSLTARRRRVLRRREDDMYIRRVLALFVAVIIVAGASLTLVAQKVDQKQPKRNKQEQQDIEALVKLGDAVSARQEQAPADVSVTWAQKHFVKGQDGKTYIPFTLQMDPSKLSAPGVAMYVRVVNKGAAATPASDKKDDRKRNEKVDYPWDNVHFMDVTGDGRVSRAMAVAGGEYDVFIAVKEKKTGKKN